MHELCLTVKESLTVNYKVTPASYSDYFHIAKWLTLVLNAYYIIRLTLVSAIINILGQLNL